MQSALTFDIIGSWHEGMTYEESEEDSHEDEPKSARADSDI